MLRLSSTLRTAAMATVSAAAVLGTAAAAPTDLFETAGALVAADQAHIAASRSVTLNRGAFQQPTLTIDLFGETVTATRDRIEHHAQGVKVWIGHVAGNPDDVVILSAKGNALSGLINYDGRAFEIASDKQGGFVLNELDHAALPQEEPFYLPDYPGATSTFDPSVNTTAENEPIVQDLLIAYTDDACVGAGGTSGVDCSQVESEIVAAVADMNNSYVNSGVDITMNLVGMTEVDYVENTSDIVAMLNDLTSTNDGELDEIHPLRDQLGADLVGLLTESGGGFCGVAWRPASPTSAFSVTARFCLTNRTLAHELGHNQDLQHNRVNASNPQPGEYNFGFRRCNDGSIDGTASPWFRTTMSYSCTSASRVGRFSNPGSEFNYLGVPTGISVADDPNRAAHAAQRLNETASYVASFRDPPQPPTPPAAPTSLTATANGPDAITLGWIDNANNEDNFIVQSSLDQSNWTTIAQLSVNATGYVDNGLTPETAYFYRVNAVNAAGSSAFSNTASATTEAVPSTVDDVATGDIFTAGTVSGTFAATHADDGAVQTIEEIGSGGPKRRRQQSYEHGWTFDVFGGAGGVMLTANAWVSGEAANFQYSLDGGSSWTTMFTVSSTSSSNMESFVLPGGTAGDVRIRAIDAGGTNGEPVDTLSVDYIVITSNTEVGTPPANPTSLSVTGTTSSSVSIAFTDNAEDEFGFEIWRNTAAPASCTDGAIVDTIGASAGTVGVSYTDNSAAPSTTYWYFAKAFNGAGDNGSCSNAASGTTTAAPNITASGSGYKVKGVQHVDITWSGASGANVDIIRTGSSAATITTANDGAYTDNIGSKGGGNYTYQVCEEGSTTECSPTFNIVF